MKGISIATDSIVYIILAVLVLTVLLFFFTSSAGPAQDRIKLETDRNNYCTTYLSYDPDCDGNPSVNGELAPFTKAQTELKNIICPKIPVPQCSSEDPKNPNACIQNCCLACPKRPI